MKLKEIFGKEIPAFSVKHIVLSTLKMKEAGTKIKMHVGKFTIMHFLNF